MSEGFGYVFSSPVLRKLGGTFVAAGLAVGLIQPLLLFVTIENLGQDKSFLQWLLMANGAAMLIGGAMVMGIAKKVKPQMLLAIGLLVSTVGTFGIGWSTSIPLTIGLQALNGLCYPLIPIGINTILMRNTPGEFIGRVGGVLTPMFMGMMVVGMTVSGVLKESLSLFAVYSLASVLFLAGAILIGKLRTGSVKATN
jgi:Na+/melibiose symporter-like transporter